MLVLCLQALHHAHPGRRVTQDIAVGEQELHLQEAIHFCLIFLNPILDGRLNCAEESQGGGICVNVRRSLIGVQELVVMQRLDQACGVFRREVVDVLIMPHGHTQAGALEPSLWPGF